MGEDGHVCTKCGLVTETSLIMGLDMPDPFSNSFPGTTEVPPPPEKTSEVKTKTFCAKPKNIDDLKCLLDICHNANLPLEYAKRAHSVFEKLKISMHSDIKVKKPKSFKALLIACLYHILQIEKCSFTLRELVPHSGISASLIATAFSRYVKKRVSVKPSHLTPRFCAKLNLSRELTKKVIKTVDHFERTTSCSLNPASVVGGIIYHYVSKQAKKPVKLKEICEVVGVSPISITRFLKRFA